MAPARHVILQLLLVAVCGWAGARWASRQQAIRGPLDPNRLVHQAPHLWIVAPLPLLLLFAHAFLHNRTDLQWRLPFWLQYYYATLSWALVTGTISYLFSLAATVHHLNRHPQRRQLLAAGVLLILAIQVYAFQIILPDPPEIRDEIVSPDGIILQSTPSTCVPASAANVARLLGLNVTERQMAGLCGTDVDGTSPAELVMAMRALGLRERKVIVNDVGPEALDPPAVIFLRGDTHATAFVRRRQGIAEVWDPQRGAQFFSRTEFQNYLRDTHAIEFRPHPVRRSSPGRSAFPANGPRGAVVRLDQVPVFGIEPAALCGMMQPRPNMPIP
jgi:hypothetical protein